MNAFLQFYISIFQMSWGEGGFKVLFYLSLLIILVLERRRNVRIVFALFPIVFHLLVFNPLFYILFFKRLFTFNNIQYYNRFFSFIPILICISLACMLLLKYFKRTWKLLATLYMIILIVFMGTNVYRQDWMKPAENLSKTPNYILGLCDALKSDDDVCIATPNGISEYIRQTDASFLTPYGRDSNSKLAAALSNTDEVDVEYIMNEAGMEDVDYVVVWNTELIRERFSNCGYDPYYINDKCIAYQVLNVARRHRFLNERRQIIGIVDYDRDGNIIKDDRGFSIMGFEYDDHERRIKEAYYDENWQLYTLPSGYAYIKREYTKSDKISRERYFDDKDQPVMVMGQAELRNEYDTKGRLVHQTCYDTSGNPCMNDYGHHEAFWEYDTYGNLILESFYDIDGKLISQEYGCAQIRRSYDENGRLTSITFWDNEGNPIFNKYYGNCHGFSYEYAEEPGLRLVYETALGLDGKPMKGYDGYATLCRYYDENERVIEERTFDEAGKLICRNEGYAIVRRVFEYNGQMTLEQYYDTDGQPISSESSSGSS